MLEQPHADPDPIIASWIDVAEANRGSDRFTISLAAFQAIAAGTMPSIDEVAGIVEMPRDDVRQLVESMTAEGRLTLDGRGESITGAGGLSRIESRHELIMYGRQHWAWCALDAVGIPAGLGVDATVHSHCSDTGEPVEIAISIGELGQMQPRDLFISLIPPSLDQSLHDCCCSEIGFYSASHNVPSLATSATVRQAMGLGRRLWGDGIPL